MKTASSLKSKPDTPKTPGGISKSLLTPCRRVGLSRNWRKSVSSPFNSPLATTDTKQNNVESRKRKDTSEETPGKTENTDSVDLIDVGTPTRKVDLPRRKKSKMLLNSITKTTEDNSQSSPRPEKIDENSAESEPINFAIDEEAAQIVSTPVILKSKSKIKMSATHKANESDEEKNVTKLVSTPVRLKSKSRSKKISPKNVSKTKNVDTNPEPKLDGINEKENLECNKMAVENEKTINVTEKEDNLDTQKKNKEKKEISPNNLTKECIVVLQKKIFKKELQENEKTKPVSQKLFEDSDSDDVPLNCLNKPVTIEKNDVITIDDDDDFAVTNKQKPKILKVQDNLKAKTSKTTLKNDNKKHISQVHNLTQSSLDDDDDDFFEKKRTILVRKSYDKVIKPLKAKSTGSITQKDIEELKQRIEAKKKMLLAKSMTDTKELRDLIKKWQKGCQDALMELMDLMKTKCPDSGAMEYSKILQTLKIPATLVGYDSDNDCFVTPDDNNVILSHVNDY